MGDKHVGEVILEWRKNTGRFATGSSCYAGPYKVAETYYGTFSKSYDGPKWKGSIILPGVRVKEDVVFENDEVAKTALSSFVRKWFARALERPA